MPKRYKLNPVLLQKLAGKATVDLMEELADTAHQVWSRWEVHRTKNSTPENEARWKRQRSTPYAKLSEEDKQKDRDIVKEYLAVISGFQDKKDGS